MSSNPALSRDQRAALSRRLARWGAAGAAPSRAASAFGIAQFALFVGFAWGASGAVAALVEGGGTGWGAPWGWLAIAVAFALLRAAAQSAETRCGFEASARIKAHVRREAAASLSQRGPAFAERRDSGETASALIDAVEKLDGYFGRYRPLMPVVMLAPFILLAAAFTQSWVVGMVFLVTAPLLPLFMAIVGGSAAAASKDQMATLNRLAGRFNDRLQSLELLNALDAAPTERKGLAAAAEDFRRRTMKVLALAFLSSAILEFFAALAVAATAVYVGFALLGELPFDPGETITLREGLFVLILAPEFYMPLRRLSAAYHDRADAEAAALALAPILDADDSEIIAAAPIALTAPPRIRFKAAGSIYHGGRRGLAPINLTAEPGRITALWGESGVGKSTALKLLMGYAPLSEGRILVDDQTLEGGLIGQAAWIAQRPRVFHGTLSANIALFDETLPPETLRAAAEAAGVMDFAASLPDGLETRVGERGYGLSGGQAQRVALARALAVDMKLLLLDEPTAHLDGEAEARFLDALKTAAQGRTVLIATHSPAVRAITDAVIDLSDQGAA